MNWNDHQNKWLHLTQCSFPRQANNGFVDLLIGIDNAELHYSHVYLREKMVDLSPDSDHLGGAVLVRLTKTRPREHDLTLSIPCLPENLYGAREKNPVVTSTTALRDSGKSRSLAQTAMADSYSSKKRD